MCTHACILVHMLAYMPMCMRKCVYTCTQAHMYVCLCIRMRTYMYMYVCVHVCVRMCMHAYVYTCVRVHARVFACVHAHVPACICVCVSASTRMCLCTHVCAHTCMCACVHLRMRARAQVRVRIRACVHACDYPCVHTWHVYVSVRTCTHACVWRLSLQVFKMFNNKRNGTWKIAPDYYLPRLFNHELINFQVLAFNCVIYIPFLISSPNFKKFPPKIWWWDQNLRDLPLRLPQTFWVRNQQGLRFYLEYRMCLKDSGIYWV